MTRDGLVERSSDGKERSVSGRDADFDLRGDSVHEILNRASSERQRKQKQPLPVQSTGGELGTDTPMDLRHASDSAEAASPQLEGVSLPASDVPEPPNLNLEHESALADKKISHLQDNADRADAKLDNARDKLPAKRRVKIARTFDQQTGKAARKLRFEDTPLPPQGQRKPSAPANMVKAVGSGAVHMGSAQFHRKIYEVEHENVGVESAHKMEIAAEGLMRGGKKFTQSAYHFARNAPYRKVSALEAEAAKAHSKLQFQKAVAEQAERRKGNAVSRYIQRQRLKRKYAQAARKARKTAKNADKATEVTAKVARSAAGFVKRHPALVGGMALIGVFMLLFSTMFTSCSSLATGMGGSIFLASYTADDPDIDNAELIYTEWETDLELEVFSAESRYPGYDEYRFNIGDISHNPFELMAFLTAVYGDFKYSDVVDTLSELFLEQYTVTYTPVTETRYADPNDEDGDGDYEPYEWKVLNISLVAKSFTTVAYTRMDDEQREFYQLYMQTKGNRQYLNSPLDFNWLPYVSSYYGYRVHPISGDKNYHKGLDIGVTEGTEIHAGHDGIVTAAAYDSGYGYYIVLDNGKGLVSKYAHCSSLLISVGQTVQSGDVIALVGNTGNSTGPHLHLEIIMNGQYLNPLYFAETNDDGSGPVYGDPGMPMESSTYGELIRVAEQYLGYPYVWGGSSPSTSFDCSGFICWIFKEAGVRDVGRTTAQGLYNLSTPISHADAQPGDLIFFTRTYSTTDTVTHVGLYVGGNMMLHAGNPIGYVDYVSRYGSLFYSFGRLH